MRCEEGVGKNKRRKSRGMIKGWEKVEEEEESSVERRKRRDAEMKLWESGKEE